MSHEPVATQGHNNDDYLVILPGPVAIKGHNSDILISLTLLIEIAIDTHKYLLTTQHIVAVTTDTQEILMCRHLLV
jgi:hypothetical protein